LIEKMQFISITGPKADIDRVVNEYLSKYEIHLENALTELQSVQNLDPYIQINPYRDSLNKASEFCNLFDSKTADTSVTLSVEDSLKLIESVDQQYTAVTQELEDLEKQRSHLEEASKRIQPFRDLHYNLSSLLHFEFIRFRFGRISKEYFGKFQDYIYDNYDTYFYSCGEDENYIWGAYFCPRAQLKKIDAVYASMHFERVFLPDEYSGTPEEAFAHLEKELKDLNEKVDVQKNKLQKLINDYRDRLIAAKRTLDSCSANFDVRRLAACTKDEYEVFYILCGWMSKKDAAAFQQDIRDDENVYFFTEKDTGHDLGMPPTKLRNPKLFRPFEMFIRMYGLPAYNEIDPTIFVSITYAFIFGAMFGDIGQGLCLFVGGLLLYKFKKMDLAAIISTAGIFSTFFGFMFGSFFGFEMENPIWLSPKTHMSTLPFLGTLNTVFIVAIGFGMFLILLSMVFHIINAVKAKDTENIWFDHNAVAGFVFYGALVAVIFLFMTGHALPATAVLVVMFVVPLLLIFFKEPLTNLVNKKSEIIPGSKGMFFVQGFFEMFEVLLSYFSNTLSFVRIGAFAVSHAAMMEVVLTLAGAEAGGNPNWLVIVLGNIFVCGLEGLIVGIQVLRLEYYELFSRFYKGNGREFKPFIKKQEN
jgi:V/A-type H+-transporting ATPase subunit I